MNTTITDHIRDILEHRRKRLWGRPQSRKIVIFQWPLTHNVVTIKTKLESVGQSPSCLRCGSGKETQKHRIL